MALSSLASFASRFKLFARFFRMQQVVECSPARKYMIKENTIKRREFLGFFLIGGLVSLVLRKLGLKGHVQEKEAMFWRRKA
jgi:hypothetical protein